MYRVVLIDDEPIIYEGLKRMVPWQDYACDIVAVANNAESGRDAILQHQPHILFTDVCMPGQDGLTMLAGLRSQFPELQVIVLSGYNDFEYAQQAIRLGVCRYLLKPSKMHEIIESVSEAVNRLKGRQQIEADDTGGSHAGGFIIEQARAYIQQHYQEKLELAVVAEKCYVSQWHLSKLLNHQLGQSFYSLLNEIRIEHAKVFLKDPGLRIVQVSEMAGYTDITHFSRVFKNVVGMSPSKYRNTLNALS